jgi:hypothetical protein
MSLAFSSLGVDAGSEQEPASMSSGAHVRVYALIEQEIKARLAAGNFGSVVRSIAA